MTLPKDKSVLNPRAKLTRLQKIQNYVVNIQTGCHEWQGYLRKGKRNEGYAVLKEKIWVDGKQKERVSMLHRIAFEEYIGPIPPGCIVRHMCDNRKCINPDHLGIGLQADNIRDTVTADRHSKQGNGLKGEKCPSAKLSDAEVIRIRELAVLGVTSTELSAMFGVQPRQIRRIVNNEQRKVVQHG